MPKDLQPLTLPTALAWSTWLSANSTTSPGVWLTLAKKGTTHPTTLTYQQALEEALCHGWIDGQKSSIDSKTFSHRFTPRTRKSTWSKRNVGIVERLRGEGRMFPSGERVVEEAVGDGRWEEAYDGAAGAVLPAEFLEAVEKVEGARRTFEGLSARNRYAIYWRLKGLKTVEGRRKGVERVVEMLGRGETVYPQKVKGGEKEKSGGKGKGKRKVEESEDGEFDVAPPPVVEKKKRVGKEVMKETVTTVAKVEEPTKPRREGLRQRKSNE
ncbi:hypothetical protein ABW19_dt0209299 [Dactylella cylindrospora]|nr:hypothetical protein ABW19_dt0209299 [Dactylella cylindrospora]